MNKLEESKRSLAPLNGLRVLASLAIFLYHSRILVQGTFPVTFFFMLTGFLLYYTKSEQIAHMTFRDWLLYVFKKLKTFYPVHLITFVYCFIVFYDSYSIDTMKSAFLNVFLVQSFFEERLYDFNGLAWYLSATMFLYLIGLFLVKVIRKWQKYWRWMLAVTALGIAVCNGLLWLEIPVYIYGNPFYRVLECFLGMLIAHIFLNEDRVSKDGINASRIEFGIFAVFCVMYIMSLWIKPKCGYYSPLFAVALYVFAQGKGCLSKLLSSKIFVKASKYCFEFYMLHELVLRTLRMWLPTTALRHVLLNCVLAFAIAAVLSVVIKHVFTRWNQLVQKLRSNKT